MIDHSSKAAIRRSLKRRRNELPTAFRERAAEEAIDHLVQHPLWQRATSVGLYRATQTEFDPGPLVTRASAARKRFVYPRIESPGIMSFRDPGDPARFELDQYGIEQPPVGSALLQPEQIDLILVPLLGWDERGYRLGYGGGFYDRYLIQTAADRVGVGFSAQEVEALPAEDHDVRLDWIVDESGIRRF